MGRGVEDLEAAARAVIGRRGSDKFYFPAPIPYRDLRLPKKLKFGYYLMDGLVKASPPCKRAVLETIKALRKDGHECVEFAVPSRMYFPNLIIRSDRKRQSRKMHGNICCSHLFRWLSCLQARDRVRPRGKQCLPIGSSQHDERPLGSCHVFDLVGSTYLECVLPGVPRCNSYRLDRLGEVACCVDP